MSDNEKNVIFGEGFIIDARKFDFFFGRVTSNSHNTQRSLSLKEALARLGITETTGGKEKLLKLFTQGLNAPQIKLIPRPYGVVIVRKVLIAYQYVLGSIEISYFYDNSDLTTIPKITTIITKIYNQE